MSQQVRFINTAQGTPQWVNITAGQTTVGQVLASQNCNPSDYTVRHNGSECSESQVIYSGDSISVTRKNLKGADDDTSDAPAPGSAAAAALRQNTIEDILNAGQGELPESSNEVYNEIFVDEMKSRKKVFKGVFQRLLGGVREESERANNEVARLTKALEQAQDRKGRVSYALNQMMEHNNIFSALSVSDMKHQASAICADLGIPVPEADDPCWNTSDDDKKSDA